MPLNPLMRSDGVSRITHNDKCPRRPFMQLALVVLFAGYVSTIIYPWLTPMLLIAGILAVQAAGGLIIRQVVRKRRAKSGACVTCEHPCQFRLDGSAPEPASEPVPVQLTSRPEWTGNAHVWNELKAYDARRFSDG